MALASLKEAAASIRENLTRSILSAVGILVGTTAVMLLISIAEGVRAAVKEQVDALGGNIVIVVPGVVDASSPFGNSGNIGISPFTPADQSAVSTAPGVVATCKWTFVGGTVAASGGQPAQAFALGVDPEWFRIRSHQFAEGRGLVERGAREAVLGDVAKRNLFGDEPAMGRTISVNGVEFNVVGVAREAGSTGLLGGNPFGRVIYLPFDAVVASIAKGKVQIDRIFAQTDPSLPPATVKQGIRDAMLKSQGGVNTFSVLTQDDLLQAIYKVLSILTYLVVGISTIALFVGGVGIMTVMLMNVNERRREIGIRKTVGAKRGDVFAQFLAESLLLTMGGGLLGLMTTWVAIRLIVATTEVRPLLTPGIVMLGFGLSVGVGCVFGLLPAIRASRKQPVEAMRYE